MVLLKSLHFPKCVTDAKDLPLCKLNYGRNWMKMIWYSVAWQTITRNDALIMDDVPCCWGCFYLFVCLFVLILRLVGVLLLFSNLHIHWYIQINIKNDDVDLIERFWIYLPKHRQKIDSSAGTRWPGWNLYSWQREWRAWASSVWIRSMYTPADRYQTQRSHDKHRRWLRDWNPEYVWGFLLCL